jgi:hypothetical protein
MALAIASFTTGWRNAHRYWYTSFFVLLGVVEVESGLEPSKRRLSLDFFFSFLEKLPIGWYLSKYGITCNDGEVSGCARRACLGYPNQRRRPAQLQRHRRPLGPGHTALTSSNCLMEGGWKRGRVSAQGDSAQGD